MAEATQPEAVAVNSPTPVVLAVVAVASCSMPDFVAAVVAGGVVSY